MKMLATHLSRLLAARGIHYGWVMAALTFGYVICSSGVSSIPSVLLVPMSREFGWSIGELSGPLGLRMALFGLVAPFAGALMLRYGPRAVLSASAVLLIAGLLIAVTMTTRFQLWLSIGVILGVAPGMTALVLGTTIATRWFTGAGWCWASSVPAPPPGSSSSLPRRHGWRSIMAGGTRCCRRPA
jgi:MFS family permease